MKLKRLVIIEDKRVDEIREIPSDRLVKLEDRRGIKLPGEGFLEMRLAEEFGGHAFFLPTVLYDWVLGTDSLGFTILVPLKKSE